MIADAFALSLAARAGAASALAGCLSVGTLGALGIWGVLGRKRKTATAADLAAPTWKTPESYFGVLFQTNPHPMWVYDSETLQFLLVNDATVSRYGYSEAEFLKMTVRQIRPPDEIPRFLEASSATGEGYQHFGIWQHMSRDGRVMHMEIFARTVEFLKRPARLVIAYDVTEREKALVALRESEKRHRMLFEEAPAAIIELNCAGVYESLRRLRAGGVKNLEAYFSERPQAFQELLAQVQVTDLNRAALKMAGAKSEAECRSRFGRLFVAETVPAVTRLAEAVLDGQTSFETQLTFRDFHDRTRVAVMRWSTDGSQSGLDLTRTQVVVTDVTALKSAETILRASEERYRDLFENAAEGIFETTPDGRWLRVNPALAKMMGYTTPAELMEKASEIESDVYVEPGRRAQFLELLMERDHILGFESEVKCSEGSTKWVSENVRVVRDDAGRMVRIQGFVVDITTRKLSEQEWLRASKLESVGILAGGIAHDFNNILTVVMGNITLSLLDGAMPPNLVRRLQEAERAAMRARDLTQQLLTFAKGGEPVRTAVRLGETVREVAEFSLHGAKTRCEYDLPPELWPVNADRGQISRVVQNLVINAMQAMPDGGVIHIKARNEVVDRFPGPPLPAGEFVKITIADQGSGIRAEHLPKIFDPYFTTKQQGSGLGLAAVYSIVKKHQGLIEVESEVGKGTTFFLWLPAARFKHTEPARTPQQPSKFQGKLLFMDDEESIRHMASSFLTHLGMEVDLAANGAEAVAHFENAKKSGVPYSVVVMDLTVPGGMGGREALEKMKLIDASVKAIVSSGYSSDPVMSNYRSYGFSGRVAKPYRVADFVEVLKDVMDPSAKL